MSTRGSERERERLKREKLEEIIKYLIRYANRITDINTKRSIFAMFELQKTYRKEEKQSIQDLWEYFSKLKRDVEGLTMGFRSKATIEDVDNKFKRLFEKLRDFETKLNLKRGSLDKRMKALAQAIKELQEAIAGIEGAEALTNLNPRKRRRMQLKL